MFLYVMGGDDIIFFRRKKYKMDEKGGEKLESALNKFTRMRDFEVLGKTTLTFEGKSYTFDAILFSFFGTVAFNIAPQGGEIYGDNSGDDWVQIFSGKRTTFANPVSEMTGSVKLFKDIYRSEKVKCGQTDTMVVFTNKDASVAVPRNLPVCHVSDLNTKLENAKYLADNGADIQAMKAAVEKYRS